MLAQRCEDLARAAREHDDMAFLAGIRSVWEAAEGAPAADLNRAVRTVCRVFDGADGMSLGQVGRLAVLGGALVEEGAEPAPLVGVTIAGLGASAEACAEFAGAWQRIVGGDRPLPDPVDEQLAFDAVVIALRGRSRGWRLPLRVGLSRADAYGLTEGWFASALWALAATTLLQFAKVRRNLPLRVQVTEAVTAVAHIRPDFARVAELLALPDEEE
jgi:hypothetical protein